MTEASAKSVARKAVARKAAGKKAAASKSASKKVTGTKAAPKAASRTATAKTATAKKVAAKKTVTRDPEGGLTAAGRAAFEKSQGAHLKPGVMKSDAEMSPEDMKRKGSWATRFYGRKTRPPLQKPNGEPTRLALTAHAWGEKVPKTEADARKIAEKGRKLLERYHQSAGKK